MWSTADDSKVRLFTSDDKEKPNGKNKQLEAE
jgi:hypothetical protein